MKPADVSDGDVQSLPDGWQESAWAGWRIREDTGSGKSPKRLVATLRKRRDEQRWVVGCILRECPAVLAGTEAPRAAWVADMIRRIETQNGNAHRWQRNFFLAALDRGARELGWPSFPYQPVVSLRLPKSPLNAETFPLIRRFAALRAAFVERLPDILADAELTLPQTQGVILLSAVLFGGLAARERLLAVARADLAILTTHEDLLWCEWLDGEAGGGNWQRWFADPLTALLLARARVKSVGRLLPVREDGRDEAGGEGSGAAVWHRLDLALRLLDLPRKQVPTSVTRLLQWAGAWLYRRLPPFVAHFATGKVASACLPGHVLERLLCGRPVSPSQYAGLAATPLPVGTRAAYLPDLEHVGSLDADLTALRQRAWGRETARHKASARQLKVRRIGEILPTLESFRQRGDLAPLVQLLCDWIIHRLRRRDAVTVCARELEAIDRVLAERVGLDDLLAYDPLRLADVYQSIADLPASGSRRNVRVTALAGFHRFLQQAHDAAPVPGDAFATVAADGSVNANLISLPHCADILARLAPTMSAHRRELAQAHQAAFLLSKGGTLRRGEILRLRLVDVGGDLTPSVVVRDRPDETLKSRQSERVVPLHDLLQPDELNLFLDYVALVRERWEASPGSVPMHEVMLFPGDHALNVPMPESRLVDPIRDAMHAVTGDTTLIVHHGRHTGITTPLLITLENILPGSSRLIGGPVPDALQEQMRRVMLGRPGLSRQHVWGASLLGGHSSPGISLGNYVHVCDWLLYCAIISDPAALWSADRMAELAGLPRRDYDKAVARLGVGASTAFALILESVPDIRRFAVQPGSEPSAAPAQPEPTKDEAPRSGRPGLSRRDGQSLTAVELLLVLDDLDTLLTPADQRKGHHHKVRAMPHGTTLESLAARHGVAADLLARMWDLVQALPYIAETREGYRSKRDPRAGTAEPVWLRGQVIGFPVPRQRYPRAAHDRLESVRCYEALMRVWQANPDATAAWLASHWRHADFETPTLRFDTPSAASDWLGFLFALPSVGTAPLRIEQLQLCHMPYGLAPESEFADQRRHWAKALQLPIDRLEEGEPSKRRPGADGKGTLRVALRFPEDMTPAWQAERGKRGIVQRRDRLGAVALNVGAYAVLLQGVVGEFCAVGGGAKDEAE
jgi:hypothetical protein